MKLFYFAIPGKAECSRILLGLSGCEWEDVRFKDRAEWLEVYKPKSPTGQAPFLELDSGEIIAQSSAIDRYAAKAAGCYSDDAVVAARIDMLLACLEEVMTPIIPTFQLATLEEKIAARQKLFAEGGASAAKLAVVEKLIAARDTDFYVSDKLSLADIHVFVMVSMISSGQFDGLSRDSLKNFTALLELRDKVASHSDIVPLYEGCADDAARVSFMP